MTVKIFVALSEKKEKLWMTFDNSIDARAESSLLEKAGVSFRIEWDCK